MEQSCKSGRSDGGDGEDADDKPEPVSAAIAGQADFINQNGSISKTIKDQTLYHVFY